jgi:hypothetical protein
MVRSGRAFRDSLRGCLCAVALVRICLAVHKLCQHAHVRAIPRKDTYTSTIVVLIRVCFKIRFFSSRQTVTFGRQIRTSPTAHKQPRSEPRNARPERTMALQKLFKFFLAACSCANSVRAVQKRGSQVLFSVPTSFAPQTPRNYHIFMFQMFLYTCTSL